MRLWGGHLRDDVREDGVGRGREDVGCACDSAMTRALPPIACSEIGISLPNNQRQNRTLHVQTDVLP